MAIDVKQNPADVRPKIKLPPVKEHEAKFPKREFASAPEAKKAFRDWQKAQPEPEVKKNPEVRIKAVPPTAASIRKLAEIAESDAAPQEIVRQRLDEDQLFGTLYSSLTTFEYLRMEGEYKRRKAEKQPNADRDWEKVVEAAQSAYAAAGLKVSPAQLSRFAQDLAGNKRNLEAVAKIANSGIVKRDARGGRGTSTRDFGVPVASFGTETARFIDPNILTIWIPDLCSQPFAQGTFTKHWSWSWNLTVSIKYWCPIWSNPTRMCWKTVTLAGITVNIGLNVGYKVTCCGASAWGQAYAQACGTIVGITKCVGCTATVVGVAGFSRVPVSSQCSYGLGINATVQCNVFGATVFSASWPFGYSVTGPCPPPGLC